MKKIIIAIAVAAFILSGIYLFQDSTNETEYKAMEVYDRIDINPNEKMVLDFGNMKIKLEGWKEDFASVKASKTLVDNNISRYLTVSENNILLKDSAIGKSEKFDVQQVIWPWFPLAQFKRYQERFFDSTLHQYDFLIHVPEKVQVDVSSNYIKAVGTTFASAEGVFVSMRQCTLPKGFKGDADVFEVKDCQISKSAVFSGNINEIRDNRYID